MRTTKIFFGTNNRRLFAIAMMAAVALALTLTACPTDSGAADTPREHTATITAFGKTITVKGDASISAANFASAKTKLQEAMTKLEGIYTDSDPDRPMFTTMLSRSGFAILITTGNAAPAANANKSMTIGIDYLLAPANDVDAIAQAIDIKVTSDNAFAD